MPYSNEWGAVNRIDDDFSSPSSADYDPAKASINRGIDSGSKASDGFMFKEVNLILLAVKNTVTIAYIAVYIRFDDFNSHFNERTSEP